MNKLKKYFFIISIITSLCFPCLIKAEINESILGYRNACIKMKSAMASKNKDDMHKALSMFDMIDVCSLSDESYTIINGKDIKPTVYYLPEYADYLLLNDFVIAELDDSSLLRDASLSPEVSLIHCGIKAKDALTIEIEAEGRMELMVFSSGKNPPLIMVTDLTNGVQYNDYVKEDSSSYLCWTMGNEGRFRLYIENSDDEDSTIVIAMN